MAQDLDKQLLGLRFQGEPWERQKLLEFLRQLVERKGADYVKKNKGSVIAAAEQMVELGL